MQNVGMSFKHDLVSIQIISFVALPETGLLIKSVFACMKGVRYEIYISNREFED